MARKRYTEEQIIAVLNEAEAGAKTAELCRRHGMSEGTFYKWLSTLYSPRRSYRTTRSEDLRWAE